VSDRITRGRNAIFGHVARLPDNTPAYQAMLRQVELSVGRPPDPSWKRPPGQQRTKWTDQLRRDNNIATEWRQAIGHGHSRATLRSEPNDDDSVTVHMPLLTAARAFGLRRRRWSSPQQCQLCCLRTVLFHIKHHYQHQTCFIAPIGTSCGLFIPLVVQLPECLR